LFLPHTHTSSPASAPHLSWPQCLHFLSARNADDYCSPYMYVLRNRSTDTEAESSGNAVAAAVAAAGVHRSPWRHDCARNQLVWRSWLIGTALNETTRCLVAIAPLALHINFNGSCPSAAAATARSNVADSSLVWVLATLIGRDVNPCPCP